MRPNRTLLLCLVLLAACGGRDSSEPTRPGVILTEPPESPLPDARYLFYLHGRIIEDQGMRPQSRRYGIYEYQAILDTLAQQGFVVISEERPSGTEVDAYARKVAAQVERLMQAGVPPERITVVGFSKGGGIAIMTSALLRSENVNFVFLAACSDVLKASGTPPVSGRILSIHEISDKLGGTCEPLFARTNLPLEHEEIALAEGKQHGTFYRPNPAWIEPVVAWARLE